MRGYFPAGLMMEFTEKIANKNASAANIKEQIKKSNAKIVKM